MSKEFWVIKVGKTYVGDYFPLPKQRPDLNEVKVRHVDDLDKAARYNTDTAYRAADYLGGEVLLVSETLTPVAHAEQIMREVDGDLAKPKARVNDEHLRGLVHKDIDLKRSELDRKLPHKPRGFAWALAQMRNGHKVYRRGWSGPGQFVGIQNPNAYTSLSLPYIYFATPTGAIVPWSPSQTDLLADDWEYRR